MTERLFNQIEVNELMGKTRQEARDRAIREIEEKYAKKAQEGELKRLAEQEEWKVLAEEKGKQVVELEKFKGQAEQYQEIISGLLKYELEQLSEEARKAVDSIPGNVMEKLDWLNNNKELFKPNGDGVGSSTHTKERKKREKKFPAKIFPQL